MWKVRRLLHPVVSRFGQYLVDLAKERLTYALVDVTSDPILVGPGLTAEFTMGDPSPRMVFGWGVKFGEGTPARRHGRVTLRVVNRQGVSRVLDARWLTPGIPYLHLLQGHPIRPGEVLKATAIFPDPGQVAFTLRLDAPVTVFEPD